MCGSGYTLKKKLGYVGGIICSFVENVEYSNLLGNVFNLSKLIHVLKGLFLRYNRV